MAGLADEARDRAGGLGASLDGAPASLANLLARQSFYISRNRTNAGVEVLALNQAGTLAWARWGAEPNESVRAHGLGQAVE